MHWNHGDAVVSEARKGGEFLTRLGVPHLTAVAVSADPRISGCHADVEIVWRGGVVV